MSLERFHGRDWSRLEFAPSERCRRRRRAAEGAVAMSPFLVQALAAAALFA